MAKRRSSSVRIGLVGVVVSLLLAGCGSEAQSTRRLVDRQTGQVLPDSLKRYANNGQPVYWGGHYIYPWWVYGGSMRGDRVVGYTEVAPSRSTTSKSSGSQSTVTRGGFGKTGTGHTVSG